MKRNTKARDIYRRLKLWWRQCTIFTESLVKVVWSKVVVYISPHGLYSAFTTRRDDSAFPLPRFLKETAHVLNAVPGKTSLARHNTPRVQTMHGGAAGGGGWFQSGSALTRDRRPRYLPSVSPPVSVPSAKQLTVRWRAWHEDGLF